MRIAGQKRRRPRHRLTPPDSRIAKARGLIQAVGEHHAKSQRQKGAECREKAFAHALEHTVGREIDRENRHRERRGKQVLIAECLKRLKEADAEGTDMPQADREEAVMMDDSKPEVKTQIHEKDAVMIGDRMFDIDGGHACGIDTVGVLYGYGNREEFEKAGAEYIISRPEELLTL